MINIKKIIRSIEFAFSGLFYVVKTQNNARFHLLATILVTLLGIWVNLTIIQWVIIMIAIAFVWITECLNTAIENFFNLVNPNQNSFVKQGKDSGAAAVLIAAIISVVLGFLVLGPALFQKIQTLLG